MHKLLFSSDPPNAIDLKQLQGRAKSVLKKIRAEDCELRRPIFLEFAGSPKSGKSTIIGIIGHFLKRVGFRVHLPPEGASLRTPLALRDDWLAFNTWSGCYALRNILEDSHAETPDDIVILDRGLFDAASWMEFLCSTSQRISLEDQNRITDFFTLDLWRQRELCVFLFTADAATSLIRESDHKLIQEPGSVMNSEILAKLHKAYDVVGTRLQAQFEVNHVDTSFANGKPPNFQAIAYSITSRIVEKLENLTSQRLLITDRVGLEGFINDTEQVNSIAAKILNAGQPRFMEREEAEKSNSVQQIVPYAALQDPSGMYFCARRRTDHSREELKGKQTILVGGHAEQIDWNPDKPDGIFEVCLRRELEEELIGIQIQKMERLGLICDNRTALGSRHLAVIYRVQVGTSTKIRRHATDQEFGREPVKWLSNREISENMANLDPWSQLAAAALFGAVIPPLPNEPSLFLNNHS